MTKMDLCQEYRVGLIFENIIKVIYHIDELKWKNHLAILIVTELSNTFLYLFIIKILRKRELLKKNDRVFIKSETNPDLKQASYVMVN